MVIWDNGTAVNVVDKDSNNVRFVLREVHFVVLTFDEMAIGESFGEIVGFDAEEVFVDEEFFLVRRLANNESDCLIA